MNDYKDLYEQMQQAFRNLEEFWGTETLLKATGSNSNANLVKFYNKIFFILLYNQFIKAVLRKQF